MTLSPSPSVPGPHLAHGTVVELLVVELLGVKLVAVEFLVVKLRVAEFLAVALRVAKILRAIHVEWALPAAATATEGVVSTCSAAVDVFVVLFAVALVAATALPAFESAPAAVSGL